MNERFICHSEGSHVIPLGLEPINFYNSVFSVFVSNLLITFSIAVITVKPPQFVKMVKEAIGDLPGAGLL